MGWLLRELRKVRYDAVIDKHWRWATVWIAFGAVYTLCPMFLMLVGCPGQGFLAALACFASVVGMIGLWAVTEEGN